ALRLPPSPPSLPLIGHLHLLSPALYSSFRRLSDRYGPILYLRLGASRCLVVSSAPIAAEIFKTHDVLFASRPTLAFADKLYYGKLGFVLAPYGDYWRFMKKVCVTELLSPRQLERSQNVRREEIRQFLSRIAGHSRRKETVDIGAELMRLTNNTTCRMLMNTTCSGEKNEAERIRYLVKEAMEVITKICFGDVLGPFKNLGFLVYGKRALDVGRSCDELMEKILKEHELKGKMESNKPKDFMDILLDIQQDHAAAINLTRTHIKAFIWDLFVAGTDTSSVAMQWAMAELISHPEVLKRVRKEIESVVGESRRLVEEEDIPRLPYLQAVVKETLRLYPSGPVTIRECRQSCKIGGYDVPRKTSVAINLFAIMRDPQVWREPNKFRPERFLASSSKQERIETNTGQSFDFIPFGGGRRACPGATLALSMINTTMAALVQCFDWKVVGEGGEEEEAKVDMQPGQGLTLGMAKPLLLVPTLLFDPFGASM
ncbi:cytochrome P450 705A22-like, partial [Cucurbita pepo subsp. pepo]|uniref:cytochrome P450 705A22-like n=1 Tax=Cucurbita pepo subsp. pepo TaxID=3664 RepID=UPI000C9D5312